jgi:DNA (cytosine-5)-methyltransferase 1
MAKRAIPAGNGHSPKLKSISLFSGSMGLDLGLEQAGIDTAVCCEIDRWSCDTVRLNRPNLAVLEKSVSDLDPVEVAQAGAVDPRDAILVGGPPCQSFSSAGKRAALNDPRGNLVFEYFRYVKALRPQAFVFENVGNLLTAALLHRPIHLRPGKHWNLAKYSRENLSSADATELTDDELSGSAFRHLIDEIHGLDYSITFGILNSADYGAPQKRVRFCMLGFRDVGEMGLPAPTHGELPLRPYVTLRAAIGDLADAPGAHSIYTDRMADFFRAIPPGGNWRSLSEEMRAEALGGSLLSGGGKTGFMRRLHWDEPAPTLTTKPNRKGTALCHPDRIRPLSVREYQRIQGFPDTWQLTGAMHPQYQQLGNAVPLQLGKALGQHLLSTLAARRPATRHSKVQLGELTNAALAKLRSYARNNVKARAPQMRLFASA